MGLREDALAAANAAVEQRKTTARTALASRLTPGEVDGLEVAATTPELVVFTDGTLHIAVGDKVAPVVVCLVEADGQGGWTRIAKVDNLTALGKLLDPGIPV